MSRNNDLSRITIDIPKKDHKRLKAMAALQGKSMREIILKSLEEHLHCQYDHTPNEETIKAISQSKSRKGLVKAKDAEDFFKKLGI